jgi:hypothetical protein
VDLNVRPPTRDELETIRGSLRGLLVPPDLVEPPRHRSEGVADLERIRELSDERKTPLLDGV